MSTMRAGLGHSFMRASLLPLVIFFGVVAYVVPASFLSRPVVVERPATSVIWKAAYSKKYPGCISTVLWPEDERPVALVVLEADGGTARVTQAEARSLAADGGLARTIGACRPAR